MTTRPLSDELDERIRRLADDAPPLTAEQRARLAPLLRPRQSAEPPVAEREAA